MQNIPPSQRKRAAKTFPSMSTTNSSSKKKKVNEGDALGDSGSLTSRINIGFIGSGNMARALVEGMLLVPGAVNKRNVYCSCTRTTSDNYKRMQSFGVNVSTSNKTVVMNSDIIVLAVKPYQVDAVLDELQETFKELTTANPLTGAPGNPPRNLRPLIISVAAGVTIEEIQAKTKISWNMSGAPMVGHLPVVRCIPSLGSSVGAGVTIYCKGKYCNESDVKPFMECFGLCSHCEEVPEKNIPGLAAISGSGPAFISLVAEALTDGGVLVGQQKPLVQKIVAHTLMSTAKLMLEGNYEPSQIKYAVSSPGGTTIKGLQVMEDRGVRGALIGAVQATAEKTFSLK